MSVKRKVTLTEAIVKIRELLESDRFINCLEYSVKTASQRQEVQRQMGLVVSRDLQLQKMPGLAKEACRLRRKLSMLREDIDRLVPENSVAFGPVTEFSKLKTKTRSIFGSLEKVKSGTLETDRDTKKAQETIELSDSCEKM